MMPPESQRLRRMDAAELWWRARQAADIVRGRATVSISTPRWDRRHLATRLAQTPGLRGVHQALGGQHWHDAHAALATLIEETPARFVIAPRMRDGIVQHITARFPTATTDAAARADRLLAGRYDLLGYRDLHFDGQSWHTDVVHRRTAPSRFWSQVPYLSPDCGDHKVTWEFNRHQHWLELGRAFWLTGDSRYRAECTRQLETWLAANPPLIGMNWASMLELAFRSLSWIWALHFFAHGASADRSPWVVDLLLGLDRQLTHVERHLSYYFSPNTHLLGEALALYVSGRTLPLLKASARREKLGRRVLLDELDRQLSADGGHCERSAHYHRYTLDFYLLALAIARITDDPVAASFEPACARLARAARALADDNGRLPHVGDDDGGSLLPLTRRSPDDARDSLALAAALTGDVGLLVGQPPEEVWWVLAHPCFAESLARIDGQPIVQPASCALADTGYYISRNSRGDHLIVDGGPHGYLNGGHAHADALAVAFTFKKRPLLIDPGTACYTIDAHTRDRFRSTQLHNTLTLDDRSQSLPRGPFHWQRTARASTRRWRTNERFDYFVGAHDGYAPLVHHRHVLMLHGDLLIVADCVIRPDMDSSTMHRAAVHWHLDPAWAVEHNESGAVLAATGESVRLHVAGGQLQRLVGDSATGLGWHSPVYGRVEPTTTLRIVSEGPPPIWIITAFELDHDNPVQRVDIASIDDEPFAYATSISIERARSIDRLVIAEPRDDIRGERWNVAAVESDACMCFARERESQLDALALVDVTTARRNADTYLDCGSGPRMPDLFLDFPARPRATACDVHGDSWDVRPDRKAS